MAFKQAVAEEVGGYQAFIHAIMLLGQKVRGFLQT